MTAQTGRSRVSLRIACCTLLVAALSYGCGGGSDAPTQPPPLVDKTPIRVVAGGEQSDTVDAILQQALVVEIRDSTGQLAVGRTVRFTSFIASGEPGVKVSALDQQDFGTFASDVADAQGRAKTLVQMWDVAGTAKLEVSIPELGVTDTVTYTVKPGLPARFTIAPRDTTIPPGASYTLKVATTDRYANPIASAVPTFTATGVSVTSAGLVTATSIAVRASIVVSYQGVSDSAGVSVVPRLPMVINRNHAVVLINSDGTGEKSLATSQDYSLSPSSVPTTPNVVYYQGDPGYSGKVWVVQPNGTPQPLLPGVTRPEGWPRLSPDGTWVYFVRDYKSLWRVHLDGTGLDSLTDFTMARIYAAPTISPDGRSVAIEDGSNGIKIVDVATKTPRTVSATCGFPRYSPDGAFFVCTTGTDVAIVRADGTGRRVVTTFQYPGPDDLSAADWTPDGKWLLVTTQNQSAELIEVSTGVVLPLTGLGGATWQASFVR